MVAADVVQIAAPKARPNQPCNYLTLSGRLIERGVLRHTPAGIAVLELRLAHVSSQIEAGVPRRVELEMACLALQEMAHLLSAAPLGCTLEVAGFLAARSRKSRTPILHIVTMEFIEGNDDVNEGQTCCQT